MDALLSLPWAVVIGLLVAVLIGVLIRIAVSSKHSTDIPLSPQVPGRSATRRFCPEGGDEPQRWP